jgi:histone acetyltransferase (RNA polymerase elongator complex component)
LSEEKLRPLIVPVFIPHEGCPHRCVYCEQERITSRSGRPLLENEVEHVLRQAIDSKGYDPGRNPEVAFYGGTFTGLPRERIFALLDTVRPFIEEGFFSSIRFSTRPDALEDELLEMIAGKGVRTIELGAQSMSDRVLSLTRRGHTVEDTVRAVGLLKKHGFRVGIQLMPGLPGDSPETFLSGVSQLIALGPDMVRLYPVLVIKGTALCRWFEEDEYHPLGLAEAIELCAESCARIENHGIPVIRIGLMGSPSLLEPGQIVAGPWHPSFGFLVRSVIHYRRIQPDLTVSGPQGEEIEIRAPEREIPLVRGYRNQGIERIQAKTGGKVVSVKPDDSVPSGRVRVSRV